MNNIKFSIFLLILPFQNIAQPLSEPFKGANTIIIETGLTSEDAYAKWGRHLVQHGYLIDKSDKVFYSLTTGPKDTSRFNYDFIVNSSVADSGKVILTMKWRLKSSLLAGTNETQFYDWDYATGKSNVKNIIYNDVLPVITSFGSPIIMYDER